MNLYLVQYDSVSYYVEAPSFAHAIDLWERHVAAIWGSDFDGTEQPESVALVHDESVIRGGALANHCTIAGCAQPAVESGLCETHTPF